MKTILRKSMVALLALSIILTSLGTLGFTASAAVNNNLLVNGDFETVGTDTDPVPGFVFDKNTSTDGSATIGADSTGSRSGNVLTLNSGSTNIALNMFRMYQAVKVETNTDYVWEFYMQPTANNYHYFGVVAGDTVKAWNTALPVTATVLSGSVTLNNAAADVENAGAITKADGSGVDTNWINFANSNGWKKIKVEFNSGDNSTVSLAYVARSTGRSIMFDDWALYKAPQTGDLVNGNFETGYTSNNDITGFVFDAGGNTGATAQTVTDSQRSGKVVSINTGTSYASLAALRFYQAVKVNPNTDYVWEFYVLPTAGSQQAFGVVAGNTVNKWKNTALPITATVTSGSMTLSNNTYNQGALSNADASAADSNWKLFGSSDGWKKVKVEFNSGSNNSVSLAYTAYASGRSVKFDDWIFYEVPKTGEILNGDFELGTVGYTNSNTGNFEVIEDPDNAANNILHVVGAGAYYQTISVETNTDYIWTFRMKDIGAIDSTRIYVVPENTFDSMITSVYEDSLEAYSLFNTDNTINVATYNKTWQTIAIRFNSGENTTVRLYHNMWATNREVYMDDWTLSKVGTVDNAGFENGTDGYTVTNITATVDTDVVHGGSQSIKLESGESGGPILSKTVTVTKNTDYQWTFWYNSITPSKVSFVGVRSADGSTILPSFIKSEGTITANDSILEGFDAFTNVTKWHTTLVTEGWCKYVVTFNSGDNEFVELTLDLYAAGRSGYTDDWSLAKWSVTAGDSNNDGSIDATDLTVLKKYLLTGVETYYKSGMNANEQDGIDIRDLVSLKKKLSDLNILNGYSLVWADDFGTTILDESKWGLNTHVSGSDDLEIRYDDSAVSVADGAVTMSAGRVDEDNYYTSASLNTMNTMAFKYGYVEMRAKVPYGAPSHPSFWMKSAKIEDATVMGEIDIFEHFCEDNNDWSPYADDYIQSGVHKWLQNENKTHLLNKTVGGYNFGSVATAEEWHTYGLLWTAEKLEFSVDGKVYHTISITEGEQDYYLFNSDGTTSDTTSDMAAFHDYYYLIMSNHIRTAGNTGGTVGIANADTQFPIDYEIDYVRLYQKADEGGIKLLNQ